MLSLEMNPDNMKIYGNLISYFKKLGQRDSIEKYSNIAIKRLEMLELFNSKYSVEVWEKETAAD